VSWFCVYELPLKLANMQCSSRTCYRILCSITGSHNEVAASIELNPTCVFRRGHRLRHKQLHWVDSMAKELFRGQDHTKVNFEPTTRMRVSRHTPRQEHTTVCPSAIVCGDLRIRTAMRTRTQHNTSLRDVFYVPGSV
jgi:hypothetical protein